MVNGQSCLMSFGIRKELEIKTRQTNKRINQPTTEWNGTQTHSVNGDGDLKSTTFLVSRLSL